MFGCIKTALPLSRLNSSIDKQRFNNLARANWCLIDWKQQRKNNSHLLWTKWKHIHCWWVHLHNETIPNYYLTDANRKMVRQKATQMNEHAKCAKQIRKGITVIRLVISGVKTQNFGFETTFVLFISKKCWWLVERK